MRKLFAVLLLGLSMLLYSCYYDSEDELYGGGCDTEFVTYSENIQRILNRNCLNCHGNSSYQSLGAGIDLEGYNDLKVWVDNGKFFSSISHDGNASPMPKAGQKLDDCTLDKIKAWIDEGALNN
jgi:hypothetical protein